jgi:hypothetical protein
LDVSTSYCTTDVPNTERSDSPLERLPIGIICAVCTNPQTPFSTLVSSKSKLLSFNRAVPARKVAVVKKL